VAFLGLTRARRGARGTGHGPHRVALWATWVWPGQPGGARTTSALHASGFGQASAGFPGLGGQDPTHAERAVPRAPRLDLNVWPCRTSSNLKSKRLWMFHVKHLNTIETRGRFKVKFGHPLQIATKLHNQICAGAVQIEAHKKISLQPPEQPRVWTTM
jgi:hypothetical protein